MADLIHHDAYGSTLRVFSSPPPVRRIAIQIDGNEVVLTATVARQVAEQILALVAETPEEVTTS